ncbi:MAG: PAS domain-containing sensor histidine kinase [Pseudomonadota bacterium]
MTDNATREDRERKTFKTADAVPGEKRMPIKTTGQLCQFIVDTLPVALVTMDADFKITSFNKRAEALTGYPAGEATGRICHEILHGSRCKDECPLKEVQGGHVSTSGLEAEIVTRAGEHIPVRITLSTLAGDDNTFIGYLEAIEDISRQKRIEREKNNFISMIAHDMKSPLTAINGLIRRLKQEKSCQSNERLQQYFRVIGEAEERLESMLQDFLEYARLESGQIRLDLGRTDIGNVLRHVTEMYRPRAAEQDIVLSCTCDSLSLIEADENRLQRVFANIIENALKYSPEKGEVTISALETEREIVIHFQDQGSGIRTEDIPHIFDAFYRAESKGKVSGHGLGLAAARALIRQHGGRISVKSMVGKGSVFTVRLPRDKKKPQEELR